MVSIIIKDVNKSYAEIHAVCDVSVDIQEGCLFGLIGPDGAGKTTLFRLITTLLIPDSGTISVFGYDTVRDYRKIRLFTGYMPGRFSLYPDLTVEENLNFYATIFGTSIKEHLHLIKPVYSMLEPFHDRLARNLSGGMKQKLALSCALIHNPKFLVLDEPTTGVDAVSRKEFWEALYLLRDSGMTILVSTPYMDEAAKCDRIAMMQYGKIMDQNTPSAILSGYTTPLFEIRVSDRLFALQFLRTLKGVKRAYLFGQYIHIAADSSSHNDKWLLAKLAEEGISDAAVIAVQAGFEDCFIDAVENINLRSGAHD